MTSWSADRIFVEDPFREPPLWSRAPSIEGYVFVICIRGRWHAGEHASGMPPEVDYQIREWAAKRDIPIRLEGSACWFRNEDDALLFRLSFG